MKAVLEKPCVSGYTVWKLLLQRFLKYWDTSCRSYVAFLAYVRSLTNFGRVISDDVFILFSLLSFFKEKARYSLQNRISNMEIRKVMKTVDQQAKMAMGRAHHSS